MDKEFGMEVVSTFGARLRRMYEQNEQAVPSLMAETLERLKRAEERARLDPADRGGTVFGLGRDGAGRGLIGRDVEAEPIAIERRPDEREGNRGNNGVDDRDA